MDTVLSIPGFHQPFSSMSHLAGAIIFAWLAFYLLRPVTACWFRLVSVSTFVAAAIALLSVSGVYHMIGPDEAARDTMLRIDLVAIFVLIAATFTPIHALMFSGWRRWGILALVWSLAIMGSLTRVIWFESINTQGGAVLFLLMGWLGGFTAWFLWQANARYLVFWSVAGGVLYSIGAIVNASGWPVLIPSVLGPHELMHFMVLGGLACHWFVVSEVVGISSGMLPSTGDAETAPAHSDDVRQQESKAA